MHIRKILLTALLLFPLILTAQQHMGMKMTMDMGTGLSASAVLADVTSGTFRMITADGDATIYASGLDLSGYVGRKIVVTDSSGNEAIGYGHSADSAESLGSELWEADASVFTSGTYSWVAFGSNNISNDSNTLKVEYVGNGVGEFGAYHYLRETYDLSSDLTTDKLYKLTCDAKVGSGDSVNLEIFSFDYPEVQSEAVTETTFTEKAIYFTASDRTKDYLRMAGMGAGEIIWLDNLSLKPVNSLGTTALQLRNARTGSTRNLASKDAGFDPNDVVKIEVFM